MFGCTIFVDSIANKLLYAIYLHFRAWILLLLLFFNTYCSSLYTPHLWWNYKKMSVSKLQNTFHNILKRNIGLSKYDSTSATCAFTILNVVNLLFVIIYSNLCVDSISETMH